MRHPRRHESEILYTLNNYLLTRGATSIDNRLECGVRGFRIFIRAVVSLSEDDLRQMKTSLSLPHSDATEHYYYELLGNAFRNSDLKILSGLIGDITIDYNYEDGVLTVDLEGND